MGMKRKTKLDEAIEVLEKRARMLRDDPWYMPCGQETETAVRMLKQIKQGLEVTPYG